MTTMAEARTARNLEGPEVVYVTSGQKTGFEAYGWGQPPAAHYLFAMAGDVLVGTDRGIYSSSGAGYQRQSDQELDEELAGWASASDLAFFSTGLDL